MSHELERIALRIVKEQLPEELQAEINRIDKEIRVVMGSAKGGGKERELAQTLALAGIALDYLS